MRSEFRSALKANPGATLLYFSPSLVPVGTSALEDYGYNIAYALNPYLGLWHSVAWLVVSVLLIERSRSFSRRVLGEEHAYGSRVFQLFLVSLALNGSLAIAFLLIYRVFVLLVGAPY